MNDEAGVEFEELNFEEEDLEEVEKKFRYYINYPLVNVGQHLYFNKASAEIIPEFIKWFTTSTLVIGLPTDEHDKNGFRTRKVRGAVVANLPTVIGKGKKLKRGLYKIYKYKDGFAFKRYEQVK